MSLKKIALLFVAVIAFTSYAALAGTASVYFGHNTTSGCTGSGVCQLGGNVTGGVTVTFAYVADDGRGNNVLTMTFNLLKAQQSGFAITSQDGTYTFTSGYTFSDPAIVQMTGVPSGYVIPDGAVARYTAPGQGGANGSLAITKVNSK